jgi:hypothetical protein
MKKLVFLACCGFLGIGSFGHAEQIRDIRSLDTNNNGVYEPGEVNSCEEYRSGPCVMYCPVTRFKEEKYCVKKCVKEPYTVCKKQCTYVDQAYTKRCCRYVPQYYTKTFCKQVPQYYDEPCTKKVPQYYNTYETCYKDKYVTEEKCRFVPYTCIEKSYVNSPNDCTPCNSGSVR